MRVLHLEGHYGRPVEIDLCPDCHLLWFDSMESSRLNGPSLLKLLQEIAAAQRQAHEAFREARCPRCAGRLREVHNRSRFGRSLLHECLRRHGAYQTFAQFLSEKGLVRAPGAADRAALAAAGGWCCMNCGAPLSGEVQNCGHCDSPVVMFDVARLAGALDPEGATAQAEVHRTGARADMPACLACGAPISHDARLRCGHCGVTLAVGRVEDALQAVLPLEQALREHQQSPAAHVRVQRMRRLQGDLDRRRAFNRELEASARQRHAHGWGFDDAERPIRESHPWTVAGGVAGVVTLLWRLFKR